MSVEIPWARIAKLAIRPRLFSGNQEGVLGGPDLSIHRLGDRWAVDISSTRLRQDAQSRLLLAALFEALTADGRIALRVPNRSGKMPSGIVLDGDGQAGSIIRVRGAYPGTKFTRGDFFSIVHGGLHYVHMIAGPNQVRADSGGRAAVPILPMLRFVGTDGDICHFNRPMIEGQVLGFDKGASFELNRTEPVAFSIQERR